MADLIQFDVPSGRRIGKAVRTVEAMYPRASPLTFAPVLEPPAKRGDVVKICTFTGSWAIDSSKVVTLKYQTATPNEYTAVNLFSNISVDCGQRNCAIAKSGTAWFLIAAQC